MIEEDMIIVNRCLEYDWTHFFAHLIPLFLLLVHPSLNLYFFSTINLVYHKIFVFVRHHAMEHNVLWMSYRMSFISWYNWVQLVLHENIKQNWVSLKRSFHKAYVVIIYCNIFVSLKLSSLDSGYLCKIKFLWTF